MAPQSAHRSLYLEALGYVCWLPRQAVPADQADLRGLIQAESTAANAPAAPIPAAASPAPLATAIDERLAEEPVTDQAAAPDRYGAAAAAVQIWLPGRFVTYPLAGPLGPWWRHLLRALGLAESQIAWRCFEGSGPELGETAGAALALVFSEGDNGPGRVYLGAPSVAAEPDARRALWARLLPAAEALRTAGLAFALEPPA